MLVLQVRIHRSGWRNLIVGYFGARGRIVEGGRTLLRTLTGFSASAGRRKGEPLSDSSARNVVEVAGGEL